MGLGLILGAREEGEEEEEEEEGDKYFSHSARSEGVVGRRRGR